MSQFVKSEAILYTIDAAEPTSSQRPTGRFISLIRGSYLHREGKIVQKDRINSSVKMKLTLPCLLHLFFPSTWTGQSKDPELRLPCPSGSTAPWHWLGFTQGILANPSKLAALSFTQQKGKACSLGNSRTNRADPPGSQRTPVFARAGRGAPAHPAPGQHRQAGQTRVQSLTPAEHAGGAGNTTSNGI